MGKKTFSCYDRRYAGDEDYRASLQKQVDWLEQRISFDIGGYRRQIAAAGRIGLEQLDDELSRIYVRYIMGTREKFQC